MAPGPFLAILALTALSLSLPSCPSAQAAPTKGTDWIDLLKAGLSAWENTEGWKTADEVIVNPDNKKELKIAKPGKAILVVPSRPGGQYLLSKEPHADIEAVIEFMIPEGSNSGVYFMGRYEIQIFDSFDKEDVIHSDCGGIYQRWGKHRDEGHAPAVNASTAPGTWQRFEVLFRAPRFDADGKKVENARFIKVVHNGQLIHENVEVTGPTRSAMKENEAEEATGPLRIQGDHGPVAFRVIQIKHRQFD